MDQVSCCLENSDYTTTVPAGKYKYLVCENKEVNTLFAAAQHIVMLVGHWARKIGKCALADVNEASMIVGVAKYSRYMSGSSCLESL